ncbi:MAG: adenylyltransferase/cytidyltransferase family protein, partial [Novosphingobium sp.]|nr:adenylyltransferase/cytidyltransferase family protein [Novosphingobium sp.]
MQKYNIGITFGGFELWHIGHLNLIKQAKELCDTLIVCVSSDKYILKIKEHKASIPLKDRIELVKAIRFVDIVDVQRLNFG